jgi:hypothetical protein
VIRFFLLLLTIFGFSFSQPLPENYSSYLKSLFPGIALEIEGGTFVGVLTSRTSEGLKKVEISDDSFLTFLGELYEEYYGKKPIYVSITVKYKGRKIAYNPFFQLWDRENNIKLIAFSKLKPQCKVLVVELNAESRRGIYIFVPYLEIKNKLLTDPPKIPVGYCY